MTVTQKQIPPEEPMHFSLTGARPGPHLLVFGQQHLVAQVSEQLSRLPSLVYMRGSLTITTSHQPQDADDILNLSAADTVPAPTGRSTAYWTILARAASLGMISGRGIPPHLITG